MAVLGSDNLSHTTDFKFNINSADRVTIDSSGRLLVGTSTARSNFGIFAWAPRYQVEGNSFETGSIDVVRNTSDAGGANILLGKSRGTSVGSNTIVAINDQLGLIRFCGSDGTNLIFGAHIQAEVDSTPGTNAMPGRLTFLTTPLGSAVAQERMRIDSAGNIIISTVGSFLRIISPSTNFDLSAQAGATDFLRINANSTQRFQFSSAGSAFSSTGTWGTISDVRIKENIADATDKLEDLKKLRVVNYNLKSDPEIKQIGFVAQEIEEVFPSLVEITGDEGSVTNVKAVKTTVLVPILVKSLQEAVSKIEILEAKVEQLEAI